MIEVSSVGLFCLLYATTICGKTNNYTLTLKVDPSFNGLQSSCSKTISTKKNR